jgi:hypothetical protein
MERHPPRAGAVPAAPEVGAWGDRVVYDGRVLFHGPALQVIEAVDGVGPDGGVATLVGLRDRGWPTAGWVLDPAALDGLLQLGVLWTEHVIDGASLPTSLGTLRVLRTGPLDGPLRAVVRRREAGGDRARFDAVLLGTDGAPVVELRQAATHRLPGEGPATARARA